MKRICAVSTSRAEYGILRPLLKKLHNDPSVRLDVAVSGTHLEERFGQTARFIYEDGFSVVKEIPLHLDNDSRKVAVKAISLLQEGLSELFDKESYDLVIILGDRYEMLGAAAASVLYNIPICHLHGGEKTLGNVDEYVRHSLSKLSHLHLCATEEFRRNIIQMGEDPSRVFNVGSLGVENVLREKKKSREELEEILHCRLFESYYVVLFHPTTLTGDPLSQIREVLAALRERKGNYIFLGTNADVGSDEIRQEIQRFVTAYPQALSFDSLKPEDYHSLLAHSAGLLGNSSSGLLEAPSLGIATLNIGERQKGRLHGPSVKDVACQKEAILQGMRELVKVNDFRNPYFQENASQKAYMAVMAFLAKEKEVKDFYRLKGVL